MKRDPFEETYACEWKGLTVELIGEPFDWPVPYQVYPVALTPVRIPDGRRPEYSHPLADQLNPLTRPARLLLWGHE